MSWWKILFGFLDPKNKLKKQLAVLHKKAFDAQRKGDLSLAGSFQIEAEKVMDEIIALELEEEKSEVTSEK
tara:strand:+ start:6323 stop:6535 length:213 start_codon:yes stop_codon:yes gene_type:complete